MALAPFLRMALAGVLHLPRPGVAAARVERFEDRDAVDGNADFATDTAGHGATAGFAGIENDSVWIVIEFGFRS